MLSRFSIDYMADWGPFLTYWGSYCKNTIMGSDSRIRFSEGLLRTLYYETDVGSIPRGIMLDSRGMRPKFSDNEDWGKQIQGCYWCLDDNSDLNGVCCGRECLYFLHEWCIERAVHFTRDRFCRFPGCDKMTYNHNIYCNEEHRAKFDCAFAKWTDSKSTSLKSIIRAGPTWYRQDSSNNSATSSKSSTQPQSKHGYNLRSSSSGNNSNQSKSTEVKFGGNFPLEFRDILVLKTDIGIIPRKFPTRDDLTSKFSQCPNWSAEIKGCHYCGKLEMKNPLYNHFCRLRCYLIFYEWCRTKVESVAKIYFCRYPECPRKASVGFQCCNKEHTIKINELYSENKITKIEQAISVAPKWYTKSSTPHELLPHLFSQSQTNNNNNPQLTHIQQSPTINYILCPEMTLLLYLNTDIGSIPRGIQEYLPQLQSQLPPTNWCTQISMCYWCHMSPPVFNAMACSNKCLFLFIEWLHMKYETITMIKFCKILGCPAHRSLGFQCCNREHSSLYESLFEEYFPLLRHTEFALGPMWYNDFTRSRIEFYNREDPFYELTNFFPCDCLFINNVQWKTTEHYFQAMKFYGTPYFYYVATLSSPRDAFSFSRKPQAMKWIHPCWHNVKLQVMLNALRAKFSNFFFANILLRTGDATLVEHTKNDKFWGDGGDGSGENKLGNLLMRVRSELRSTHIQNPQPTQPTPIQPSNNQPCNFNAPRQEVNKQIQSTAPHEGNTNGKDNDTSDNITNQPPENHPGFIANLVKPNNDSNTSNAGNYSSYNPFNSSNPDIILGEAKYQLPADYICPFDMPQTDNMDTEHGNETTTMIKKPDSIKEMNLPGDSIDLIKFDNPINAFTLKELSNQDKKQDSSTTNANPFEREETDNESMDTQVTNGNANNPFL